MKFLKYGAVIILILTAALYSPSQAFFGSSTESYETLAELADAMAKEMKSDLAGNRLSLNREETVSYTHLTLPTIYSV